MSRRRGTMITAIALVALVAGGCSSGGDAPGDGGGGAKAAQLTISPANGTRKVAPNLPVTVKVAGGKLSRVTVTPAKGDPAAGALAADGLSWRSSRPLRPATTYTVTAQAAGEDGKPVSSRTTFTTLTPQRRLESGMSPLDGETVGVGMPVQLFLSEEVNGKANRAAVERALEVSMSKPVEGAWSWINPREVDFRPREYWPTGEKVRVVARLTGVRAGKGLWGMKDRTLDFTVGPRHITKVSASTHKAKVTSDGKLVRSIPVSLGKPGDDSYSGTMIAQEKSASTIMDSATIGKPGEYRIRSKWNVRMTYSGTFFHAAPWSTGAQGNSNVSHGCVNASPENAKWFFHFTNRGDIIQVSGTSRQVPFGSGPTPWAKSWTDWLAGSALGKPVGGAAAPAPTATP
ncbi:MAG TPA: Ig-like domain-containing protein [Streptosporangiaceae bacterium]|nr:Ig-like domain-containing protein [Streptosporangiaceae bacterium]